jgi:hypothetical protein
MRKNILIPAAIFFFFTLTLNAIEKESFDKTVDFSLNLKQISTLVLDPNFNLDKYERFVIFDGSVSSITIIDPAPESFVAEIEIVGGEWKGLEQVVLYRVFVYVQGPEFAKRLPERRPRDPDPNHINLNEHALVAGQIADVYTDEKNNRFAVIVAHYLRIIQ